MLNRQEKLEIRHTGESARPLITAHGGGVMERCHCHWTHASGIGPRGSHRGQRIVSRAQGGYAVDKASRAQGGYAVDKASRAQGAYAVDKASRAQGGYAVAPKLCFPKHAHSCSPQTLTLLHGKFATRVGGVYTPPHICM